jgi:release factor glutamine methyltransferase
MNKIEILFSEILKCRRHQLYLNQPNFTFSQSRRLKYCLTKLSQGMPLQYVLGKVDFMGLELEVDRRVFIPRPETELLVETTISYVNQLDKYLRIRLNILDVGTGSGCIAISLAKFLSNVALTACDVSAPALEVARYNGELNKVDDKIEFICSDLFQSKEFAGINFDMIVSNPPYIPSPQIDQLPAEVRLEPRPALDGGSDGLNYYRKIIKQSPGYLKKRGLLIMEIGFRQCREIKNIFKFTDKLEIIDIIKDYNRIERIIVASKIKQ